MKATGPLRTFARCGYCAKLFFLLRARCHCCYCAAHAAIACLLRLPRTRARRALHATPAAVSVHRRATIPPHLLRARLSSGARGVFLLRAPQPLP